MWSRRADLVLILTMMFLPGYAGLQAQAPNPDVNRGAQRFMEYCAGCHGADGRGGDKAPPLVSAPNIMNRSDAELLEVVRAGTTGGMPPFAQIGEENIRVVVGYLRWLENNGATKSAPAEAPVTGDANAGRKLFFGKAQCSACHLVNGKGGFIATDLTNYGRNRGADTVLHAITTPDIPLVPWSRVVTVTTTAGRKLTGMLRNEDNFSLALQTEDGRYHLLARSDVANVDYSAHSLMPRDYSSRLSPQELNDIVSFLIVASRSPHADKADGR
jgi:cytochrome c oxidase cbb3-type subunit 3